MTRRDAQGRFRFDELAPGTWCIAAGAPGGAPAARTVFCCAAAMTEITLDLRAPACLRGRFVDALGSGRASPFVVRAADPEDRELVLALEATKRFSRSAADGTFVLEGLPPGRVQLVWSVEPTPVVELAEGETLELVVTAADR